MTNILLVDDDPSVLEFLGLVLGRVGYRTVLVTSGAAALEAFETFAPDLILLDVVLPDIDGFEVCRRIRRLSLVPILFLSGQADERDAVVALDLGGDNYMTKPFRINELLARIKAALRRSAEHQVSGPDGRAMLPDHP